MRESHIGNVRRVSQKLFKGCFFEGWVIENLNSPKIISSDQELSIMTSVNRIDIGSIGAWGINALDPPAESASVRVPLSVLVGRSPTCILFHAVKIEVKKFIGCAIGL